MKRLDLFIIAIFCALIITTVLIGSWVAYANPGNCYWVGDTNGANWNDASHWSSTSGGAGNTCEGGANIPMVGTAVNFNSANNNSVTVDTDVSVASITAAATSYTGTFDATTHNITTSGNLTFSSGVLSMGSGIWTIAGGVIFTSLPTLNAGDSTLVMNGTGKGLIGNTKTLNNLQIAGTGAVTVLTSNVTVAGTLTVDTGKTLTITGVNLYRSSGATTTINGTGIIGGTGTLYLYDTAGALLGTGGTLSSLVRFDATAGDANVPARTYGAAVTLYSNSSTSSRAITLGTDISQTLTFNTTLNVTAANTNNIIVTAATYNPVINITGNFTFTKSSTGIPSLSMGNGTWTESGSFTLTNGAITAGSSTLVMNGTTMNLIGNSQILNNLQISGTISIATTNVFVAGILTVDNTKTLTISGGKILTMNSGSTTTINGTITGSTGTLILNDSAGANLGTDGSLSSKVEFNVTSGNAIVPARSYDAPVDFYSNSSSSMRTVTLGTSSDQTLNFSSNFYILAANTQNIDVSASVNNPAVNITGTLDFTGAGAGSESFAMGSGTWTVSGNIDLIGGTANGGTSTLVLNGSAASQTLTPNQQIFNNIIIKNTNALGTILSGNTAYFGCHLSISGNLYLSADGASNVLFNTASHDCDISVAGNLGFIDAGAGTESILMGNNLWSVNGDVDFTGGTVDKGSSTLDLSGSAVQTLTLAGQALNNLRVSNSSGSNVNLIGDVSGANFIVDNANSRLVFKNGATYSFTNIYLDGKAAATKIALVSSTPDSQWLFNVTGSSYVNFADVSDSDASLGNEIIALNSTNSGNNLHWTISSDQGGISPNQKTWTLSSDQDFTISDSSKVKFSNGSAKIIPTGFETSWGKIWHDTHFAPNPGNSGSDSIVTDSSGNLYISGYTNDGIGGIDHGFIVKLDQDLNEIWYKNDYFPSDDLKSETYRMIFASDGNIVVHGGYQDSSSNCHSVLMKINPNDGSVIWSTTIDQPIGVVKISGWDRAAGPVIDKNGNIYIAMADHLNNVQNDGEPTGIYKFDSNGNLLWNKSDSLASHKTGYFWEDLWDMVIDSEGSVYLSYSAGHTGPSSLYTGLLKYDTDGNYQWNDLKLWPLSDTLAAGRGIAIDTETDTIYQNGNAGGASAGAGCGLMKYDKDGIVLYEEITHDIPGGGDTWCWGSSIDQFGNWTIPFTKPAFSYMKRYRGSDLSMIGYISNDFSPRLPGDSGARHTTIDQWGNSYSVTYFADNDYSAKESIAVLKGVNIYPNTTLSAGTPLTLINKTPVSYTTLSGFSATYGPMDQADVDFQISNNGTAWYFWNGSNWAQASGTDVNTAAEIDQNVSKFSDQFGAGQFYFKAFMLTDGTKEVDLASVSITSDQPLVNPPQDSSTPQTADGSNPTGSNSTSISPVGNIVGPTENISPTATVTPSPTPTATVTPSPTPTVAPSSAASPQDETKESKGNKTTLIIAIIVGALLLLGFILITRRKKTVL